MLLCSEWMRAVCALEGSGNPALRGILVLKGFHAGWEETGTSTWLISRGKHQSLCALVPADGRGEGSSGLMLRAGLIHQPVPAGTEGGLQDKKGLGGLSPRSPCTASWAEVRHGQGGGDSPAWTGHHGVWAVV